MKSADSWRSDDHDFRFIWDLLYLPLLFKARPTLKAVAVRTRCRDTPMSHLLPHTLTHSHTLTSSRSDQVIRKDAAAAPGNHPPAHRGPGSPVCVDNSQRECNTCAQTRIRRHQTCRGEAIRGSADARACVCVSHRYGRRVKAAPRTCG